jgi:hypothetical protein
LKRIKSETQKQPENRFFGFQAAFLPDGHWIYAPAAAIRAGAWLREAAQTATYPAVNSFQAA